MIRENTGYSEGDDVPKEEWGRILNEVAQEKGYRDAEHLRNRAAKNRGFVNWPEYRMYLFRAGQIHLTRKQEQRLFPERVKKKRKSGKQAIGRLIGNSPNGIKTKRIWIKNRLRDPIDFVEGLRGCTLRPIDIYEILGMNRQEYVPGLEVSL